MRSWSGLSYLGGQSSFTMCRLNLNLKLLGEILVWSVIPVGSIIFHHVQTKSKLKTFRWDPGLVCHTLGGQSSLTMCRLNLNLKLLGEILVWEGQSSLTMHRVKSGGSWSLLSYLGGQTSLTMCRLNLNLKILGEILVWSVIPWGVNHLWPCTGWSLT